MSSIVHSWLFPIVQAIRTQSNHGVSKWVSRIQPAMHSVVSDLSQWYHEATLFWKCALLRLQSGNKFSISNLSIIYLFIFYGSIKISFDMLDLQICHAQQRCFDMKTRRDPTLIGTDEYGNSIKTHYHCTNGYCSEIHSLKCERRCNEKVFNTTGKNTFIFNGERIIIAR